MADCTATPTPESDDDCLGKFSMTTMDGERDSTAYLLKQQQQQQPSNDNDNDVSLDQTNEPELESQPTEPELESQPTELEHQDAADAAPSDSNQAATDSSSSEADDSSVVVTQDKAPTTNDATAAVSTADDDDDDLEELPAEFAAWTTTTTSSSSTVTVDDSTPTEESPAIAPLQLDEPAAPSRRMTYIGEGLLDAGGMDAIDRLSDVSPYAAPSAELANLLTATRAPTETPQQQPAAAAINRLQAFLTLGGSSHKPAQLVGRAVSPAAAAPARAAFPPPLAPSSTQSTLSVASTPPAPTAAAVAIENRRSKLLDFLATDVGERYLDGVYEEETRVAPDEDDSASSASDNDTDADANGSASQTPVKTDTERSHAQLQRTERANSKLLAFLAKERGERLHRVERNGVSISIHDAPPASQSATAEPASTLSTPPASSTSQQSTPEPKTPSKLLAFVAKVVPDKPKLVIFDPADAVSADTDDLEHVVAEAAERKKQKREDRERARQKVLAFLAEEDGGDAVATQSTMTVKSVDETKVQREKVVDRYGREGLLDFLDRTDAHQQQTQTQTQQQQRIQWATARGSSHDSASPVSSASSSPKSLLPAAPAATQTASSLTRTPSAMSTGNRLASFLSKITAKHTSQSSASSSSSSSSPEKTMAKAKAKAKAAVPSSPATKPGDDTSATHTTPATLEVNGARTTVATSKMPQVLAALEQITQTCTTHELSDVSVARITTLLTSISQIVKDDVQRSSSSASPSPLPVRRWSNASSAAAGSPSSWVKSANELEDFDRKHAAAPTASSASFASTASTAVLERDSELNVTVASTVLASFGAFESAQNLLEIVAAFHALLADCGLTDLKLAEPSGVYDHVKAAVASKLSFRQKQLFKLLDTKRSSDPYAAKPAAHKRVCVIGAGPVGMRAAVEMALLGAQVVVVEKRKHFSRENILHLWPWVVQDLTALGAKVLFPQFCHSTAYFHVGTRQLQCILLKVALLLGVTFFPATAFDCIAYPDSIDSHRQPFYTVVTKPQIPWMEFTAVLGASGTQDRLSAQARIKRFVFSRKEAIGLVCYFPNTNAPDEKRVAEFSWTIQFKQQMFAKMRDIGVDLENIVYYRGEMHYLVMTPKRQNLLDQGVLKHDYPNVADLVLDDNIDKSVLHKYLERVVEFVKIPQKADFARVRIFDFSARTRADKAASILTSKGKKLYVGLIGDSLMEPFWPEGLGTCRGFLSALDGCWMVARVGFSSDEQLLADRELAYRIIQHVSGFRRDDLQKNVRKYTVDPTTRYTVKFPQLC